MSAQSLIGQSISIRSARLSAFGGMDDRFVIVDDAEGSVTEVASTGRTVLLPWNSESFVSIAGLLGRESRVTIELRDHASPDRVRDSVCAGDMPAAIGAAWGSSARLVPGVYPVLYRLGDGAAAQIELTADLAEQGSGLASFVPGVFRHKVAVTAGGESGAVVDLAGEGSALAVPLGTAVGHGDTLWAADRQSLWIVGDGKSKAVPLGSQRHPPVFIDYDPGSSKLVIGFWRRWASQGGPATDVFVFGSDGSLAGSGSFDGLTRRAAIGETSLVSVDIEGRVARASLSNDER